uniref:NSL1 component of MIS12 kinetochore complex n=1 Tax=Oryctolagus cuniculus TaxID=9986 RepID=A0A5F9D1L6_RABIT
MAGAPEAVVVGPPQDEELVAATASHAPVPGPSREDFRVRCTSKRAVTEVLELCGSFMQKLGDALPEEIREPVLRDVQWTFESAVQENVSINGQAWQEASDNCFMDSDIKKLEDQFDEIIVDLTTKRKQYPRKILECVIKTIKAQHEILKQYHPVVYPLDLKYDPDPVMARSYFKFRHSRLDDLSSSVLTLQRTQRQFPFFPTSAVLFQPLPRYVQVATLLQMAMFQKFEFKSELWNLKCISP